MTFEQIDYIIKHKLALVLEERGINQNQLTKSEYCYELYHTAILLILELK
jgi:hypothetical protein